MIDLNLLENSKKLIEFIGVEYLNSSDICGYGTTRVVYKGASDYVVKFHIHEIGYKQSLSEKEIYTTVDKQYLQLLDKPLMVTKQYSVYRYHTPLLEGVETGEVSCRQDMEILWSDEHENLIEILQSHGVCVDDLDISNNCSLNDEGKLMYIDYGFKNDWFEELLNLQKSKEVLIPCDIEGDLPTIYHDKVLKSLSSEKEASKEILTSSITDCIKSSLLAVVDSLESGISEQCIKSFGPSYTIKYIEGDESIAAYCIYSNISKSRLSDDLYSSCSHYDSDTLDYFDKLIDELDESSIYIHYIENISKESQMGSKLIESMKELNKDILLYSACESENFWSEKGFDNIFGYEYFHKTPIK